jgi:SWI/SNF-related matrix-associated actin-dependent regulator 1 of chromatin subfamily A
MTDEVKTVDIAPVELNLETLASWGQPQRTQTKFGPRIKREARKIPPDFWSMWRANKDALKAAGISPRKDDSTGEWSLTWWQKLPEEEQAARASSVAASVAEAIEAEYPLSEMCKQLGYDYMPFQKAGIHFALSRKATLFGDEQGLGKTIQIIGVINARPELRNIVIAVPASLTINWRNELQRWLVNDHEITILSGTKPYPGLIRHVLSRPAHHRIVIVNYAIIYHWLDELLTGEWHYRVCDEAHKLKNPKAKRTLAALSIGAPMKAHATGTPIPNRVMEGLPIFKDLDPIEFENERQYRYRYAFGTAHLGELQQRLRSTIMVRRLKRDVLKELPAKRRQVIEVPVGPETRHVVEAEIAALAAAEEVLEVLKARVEIAKVADNQEGYEQAVEELNRGVSAAFTQIALLRHQTAIAKVPDVIAHIEGILEEGHKLLVFAHHRDVLKALHDHFEHSALIWGGMAAEDKQAEVERFQSDEACRVFVGQIEAAGVGITLTAATRVVFAELDWVPGNVSQAEDRAHRIGQHDSVLVQHLVLEGSLDATMAKRLVEKQDAIDKALDDPVTSPAARESIIPTQSSVTISRREIEEAPEFTEPQRAAIHLGLQMLAGMCDGARQIDGVGFNKLDTNIGKSLAHAIRLTNKQAALGRKLVTKYRRQLPPDLLQSFAQTT